jgi:hypothetical protein
VTRNANSVKNALEKFPINFDNGETNRWGEEADQRSSKCEALRSMCSVERATLAPLRQTSWRTETGSSALAFSLGTGTTTRSRSTIRFSASRTYRGISAASGLIFCATADDGSARSIVPLATRGAAGSATNSRTRHGRRLHDNA